MYIEVTSRKIL